MESVEALSIGLENIFGGVGSLIDGDCELLSPDEPEGVAEDADGEDEVARISKFGASREVSERLLTAVMVFDDEAEVAIEVSEGFSDRGGASFNLDGPEGSTTLIVERLALPGTKAVCGRAGNFANGRSSSCSEGDDGGEVACEKRLDRVGDCEEP
jgi:hypothetical protein